MMQVTKLMGYEPLTKYVVLLVVSIQLGLAVALRHTSPLSPTFLLCAYVIGGTANHNLFLAIHEITHNLGFRGVIPNKLLAIFANLPIGIPYSAAFKVALDFPYLFLPTMLTTFYLRDII
jgi:sphingolipid delta-4 desaturase